MNKKSTTDYVGMFSVLNHQRQSYFRLLQTHSSLILKTYMTHTDTRPEYLDLDVLHDWASGISENEVYSRFDRYVLHHLSTNPLFEEIVEARKLKGFNESNAVRDTFLAATLKAPKGRYSSAYCFMTGYIRWCRRNLHASLDRIMEEAGAMVDATMTKFNLYHLDSEFGIDADRAYQELAKSTRTFITTACRSRLDRRIAQLLLISMNKSPDYSVNISTFVEHLIQSGKSDGKSPSSLRSYVEFTRRKLAAWFVIDDVPNRIRRGCVEVRGKVLDYRGWFLSIAGVRNFTEAKRLVMEERRERQTAQKNASMSPTEFTMKKYEDTFLEIKRRYAGIKSEEDLFHGVRVLKLFYSVTTNKVTKRPTTIVYENGGFQDFYDPSHEGRGPRTGSILELV